MKKRFAVAAEGCMMCAMCGVMRCAMPEMRCGRTFPKP